MKAKTLLVIVGPTAVGKTAISVSLAEILGTDIISADSRQFYREIEAGTAKPSEEELARVKHHFINSHSIEGYYSVGSYMNDCLLLIQNLFQHKDILILTGGSGLYIDAVCKGMDEMPEINQELRAQLNDEFESKGLESLLEKLEKLDPSYYLKVDKANPQRVIRALEVCIASGKPYSEFREKKTVQRDFNIVKIGLKRDREELYMRIDTRVDAMLANGLVAEAVTFHQKKSLNALQTVGYTEVFDYLEGKYDLEEAIRLIKRNSRRYAKRQMTWFNRDAEITWLDAENPAKAIELILEQLKLKA